jgi:hypothetical protein
MANEQASEEPTRLETDRPCTPDYGVLDAKSGRGLLPWSWAVERLSSARSYRVATFWSFQTENWIIIIAR